MKTNIIYNKDCLLGIKELPDNSIDLLCTDPPYGISFMSRQWDKALPSLAIWKESLRVLKPGAFAFVMCIPRQDCLSRMVVSLGDVGFNVSFSSIYWAYASGFPKSARLNRNPKFCQCGVTGHSGESKDHEQQKVGHNGKAETLECNDHSQDGEKHLNYKPPTSQDGCLSKLPCDELPHPSLMGGQDTAQQQEYAQEHSHSVEHGDGKASESLHTPSQVQYNDHLSNQDCSLPADSESDIGEYNLGSKEVSGDASIQKDTLKLADHKLDTAFQSSLSTPPIIDYTTGFPTCQICGKPKADGAYCGAQFKPAVEVILVAMKPLSEKTYVDQALANRHGISWLDEGRIPYKSEKDKYDVPQQDFSIPKKAGSLNKIGIKTHNLKTYRTGDRDIADNQGRFPANIICQDDILNDGISREGGQNLSQARSIFTKNYQKRKGIKRTSETGSFSRYFSLDAWFDKKLSELPEGVRRTFPFLVVPKASKSEKNKGCEGLYWEKDNSSFGYHQVDRQRWDWLGKEEERIYKETDKRVSLRAQGNIHPTVKPLKLGFYLATIGSREGDVMLDPFGGSGWMAVVAKSLGRHYIVFETEKENCKIANKRLSAIQTQLSLFKRG